MAMVVVTKGGREYERHIGGKLDGDFPGIDFVQADGHELERAIEITGLPMPPMGVRTMKFPQPWAQLIIMNWR